MCALPEGMVAGDGREELITWPRWRGVSVRKKVPEVMGPKERVGVS